MDKCITSVLLIKFTWMVFLELSVFNIFSRFQFIFSSEHWQTKYQEAVKENKTLEEKLLQAETENSELQIKYGWVEFLSGRDSILGY